jgi:hypothetical protein
MKRIDLNGNNVSSANCKTINKKINGEEYVTKALGNSMDTVTHAAHAKCRMALKMDPTQGC